MKKILLAAGIILFSSLSVYAAGTNAKNKNPLPPKNEKRCNVAGMVGVYKNGACEVNMLEGMSKQEKADYHRAKDFEEEYDNYKKYKSY